MKFSKFIIPAIVSSMILGAVTTSYAGSIGRSSSSSSSHSSSSSSARSSPSVSRPSAPAAAPHQSGGIGGQSSMGVRKSEVTAPVAQKVEQKRPQPTQASPASTTPGSPAYSTAPQPTYAPAQSPGIGAGGVFMSSLGGSLAGNLLANSLFGNHGSSGTTVVNNNGGGGGPVAQNGPSANGVGSLDQGSQSMPVKKSYGIGDFIMDIILFALLIGVVVCIVWAFYKGYKMIRDYVNKERGTGTKQPFSPTAQFWLIQNAFATADIALLKTLLGPDLVDEATRDLEASSLSLKNVSHEVVLDNASEFSVHYTFNDGDIVIDQVWHYEQHAKSWKLNGIETV